MAEVDAPEERRETEGEAGGRRNRAAPEEDPAEYTGLLGRALHQLDQATLDLVGIVADEPGEHVEIRIAKSQALTARYAARGVDHREVCGERIVAVIDGYAVFAAPERPLLSVDEQRRPAGQILHLGLIGRDGLTLDPSPALHRKK